MSQKLRNIAKSINDETNKGGNTKERVASGFYQVDEDLTELQNQIKQAELDKDNNKGIFGTLASLELRYPRTKTKEGFYAFVGTDNPRERYHVTADGGDWLATGDFQNVGGVEMGDYAKKVNASGEQVVYSKDGKMPEGALTSDNISNVVEGIDKPDESNIYTNVPIVMDYDWVEDKALAHGEEIDEKNSAYSRTYIPVLENQVYDVENIKFMSWYDADKVFIGERGFGWDAKTFVMPKGSFYVRFVLEKYDYYDTDNYRYFHQRKQGSKNTVKVYLRAGDIRGARAVRDVPDINIIPKNVRVYPQLAFSYNASISKNDGNRIAMTDFIEVEPSTRYSLQGVRAGEQYIRMYDANKGYLYSYRSKNEVGNFATHQKAKYIRFNVSDGDTSGAKLINMTASADTDKVYIPNLYVPYSNIIMGDEPFLELIHFGDSHSTGFESFKVDGHWVPWIHMVCGMLKVKLNNQAVTGSHLVGGKNNVKDKFKNIPENFSGILSMMIGTNDFINGNQETFGNADDTMKKKLSDLDETIYFDAYRKYIIELRDKYPRANLVCWSNIYLEFYNDKMDKWLEFQDGMRKICAFESIPFLNIGSGCWTKNSVNMADKLHPDNWGARRIAIGAYGMLKDYVDAKKALNLVLIE